MTEQQQKPRRAWNGEQWSTWDGSKWVLDAVQGSPPPAGVPWTTPAPERPDMRAGAKSRGSSGAIAGVIALIIVLVVAVAIVRQVNSDKSGTAAGGSSGGAASAGGGAATLNGATVSQTATFNSKGAAQVTVTIHNTTTSDADYLVNIKATSADGASLYDTGQASFHGISAGDSDQEPATLFKLTQQQATGAKFVVTSVKKLAATAPSFGAGVLN